MTKKTAPARASATSDEMKSWGFIGILLPIIGYVIILLAKKGGSYAEFYGKQGLVLGIVGILLQILGMVFSWFFLGWLVRILFLVWFIIYIIGIVYAFSGEKKQLPLIGEFAGRF